MVRAARTPLLLAIALVQLARCAVRGQIPDTVILLEESTFEHHTQASTGQTAGQWFVLFNSRFSSRKQAARDLWAELARDEDKEVIFAEVMLDDEDNRRLARQFENVQPPAAVLFRDRQMFEFPSSLTAPDAADQVRRFWKGGYQDVLGARVPERPGLADLGRMTGGQAAKPDSDSGFHLHTFGWGGVLILIGITIHSCAIFQDMRNKARAKREAARAAAAHNATNGVPGALPDTTVDALPDAKPKSS